jgi:predicted membrane-bound spermidine synthase
MSKHVQSVLFATVFATGAAVLIFELAAVRALSPYFGASIYVVSGVLTVILAALSVGYYFGGRLADKYPESHLLYTIIAGSGLIMNLLIGLSLVVFPIAGALLPITWGPLFLSLIFFFFPAFLLGIDSPFIIKLLTRPNDTKHNGAVVGSTFFWSTCGSIFGSLVSGFFLIPFLGVKLTFVGTATTLTILACIAYLSIHPYNKHSQASLAQKMILAITLLAVVVAAILFRLEPLPSHPGTLLYRGDGYYSQIEVREIELHPRQIVRVLHREINSSSAIELGTTDFTFQYPEYSRAYRALKPDATSYLAIGGGAYTVPRTLLAEDEDLMIDVVEIEPRLIDLAHTYFELPESPRLTNYPMDARVFLNTIDKKYDVIFMDVFQSGHFIPAHLTTTEFFTSIREHLTDDGLLIINTIGAAGINAKTMTGSLIKTLTQTFPNPHTYLASTETSNLYNIIVIARNNNEPSAIPDSFVVDLKNGSTSPATERLIPLKEFYLDAQMVFTDDLAPVEFLIAKRLLATY